MTNDNDVVIQAWNTVLFDKFCRFKHLLTDGVSAHSEAALERHRYPKGARVLDVGCGFGDSTRAADCRARGIDRQGHRRRLRRELRCSRGAGRETQAIDNASFFAADVQSEDLRGPYDFAFSRFGTMFFMLPGAAMRNIRKALKPGGDLTMIVWRRREENPWLYEAELRVRDIVSVVAHDDTDQVHCGPGPFSMAGPDMVSTMLRGAGYRDISFERFDADICIGKDVDEAIEFAMALGPAGEIIRLAGEEGETRKRDVAAALRDALSPYARDTRVWAPSSTWFVSARNP